MARPRIARWWLVAAGLVLALSQAALVLAWWKLPEWAPLWTAQHAPTPEMALRAMRYDADQEFAAIEVLQGRALAWGGAIGPALRRQFAHGDARHRLRMIGVATAVAQSLAAVVPGVPAEAWRGRVFSAAEVRDLREDLCQLALAAVADGAPYLASNASYVAASLADPRVVPAFCAFLHGQKTPIGEDLEPVVRMLGGLGDVRAVPALIPLLPIRHKAHPVVEEALARCLDLDRAGAAGGDLVTATRHDHEVVRAWAARQFARQPGAPGFAERLVALVDDPQRQVSLAAIQALAAARLAAAGPALLRLAGRDGDGEPRRAALAALGILGHAPAAPLLRALAQTPDEPLRGPAITALAALGDPADTALLIPLLRETEPGIAALARAALEQRPLSAEQRQQLDETK